MDPHAALIDLLEAIHLRDFDAAAEIIGNLAHWSAVGGFIPESIHDALDALRFSDHERTTR